MSSDWVEVQIEYKPGLTACYQLPPGYVIVPAGDVPTPEERAAETKALSLLREAAEVRQWAEQATIAAAELDNDYGSAYGEARDSAKRHWSRFHDLVSQAIEAAQRVAAGGAG